MRNTPLSEDEVREVVREITADSTVLADGVINRDEIEQFIEGVAHHDGGPENIRRVAAKLAEAGWPLDSLDD